MLYLATLFSECCWALCLFSDILKHVPCSQLGRMEVFHALSGDRPLRKSRNPVPSLPPRILDETLRGPIPKPKAPSFRLREVWGFKGPTAHHSSLRPGDDGCKQLSDGLKPLASLQHLHLDFRYNQIGPGPRQSEVQGFDSSVGARKLGVEWP